MHHARALIVDTHQAPLPPSMREAYLGDLQAWVVAGCRRALLSRGKRHESASAMLDEFLAPADAAAFSRWHSIGPHAALRREYRLSSEATSILLYCAGAKLWHILGHVYAAMSSNGRGCPDAKALEHLLGDRDAVLRELCRESPLVSFGLVTVRSSGTILASDDVLLRLTA